MTTYGYDAAGGPDTSVLDPDGVETDTHVDLAHDERTVTTKKGSATLASFDYHLDADGRDLNVVEHQANVGGGTFADARIDWTYDADDKLQKAVSSVSGETDDAYDGNGSLKTSTHGGQTDTYTYDARNRLVGATVGGQGVAYGYDDAGDRTSETAGGVMVIGM